MICKNNNRCTPDTLFKNKPPEHQMHVSPGGNLKPRRQDEDPRSKINEVGTLLDIKSDHIKGFEWIENNLGKNKIRRIFSCMAKVPITFEHDGQQYSGTLESVQGIGASPMETEKMPEEPFFLKDIVKY